MCNSETLPGIFSIVKRVMLLIQIIVPILLIVFASISLIKLLKNPEEKKGTKKIINQFIAAVIVFFIPLLVNVVMNLAGDRTEISSCWNSASDKNIINNIYNSSGEKERKKITYEAKNYEYGISNNCPRNVSRTRTSYNNITLKADTSFSINAQRVTQVAAYDCQNIIAGQNNSDNSGGRVAWFDITTGEIVASVDIGPEGTHMARLAYDSDRNVVLIGTGGSNDLLQIDNKTKTIMTEQKYVSMTGGGGGYFIKYDSYNHQLIGLSRTQLTYMKYNEKTKAYERVSGIELERTSMWDPQNFNTDGQVIYIANSNPNWDNSNYGILVYDMKTGKIIEDHKLDGNVTGGHIEDVIVDVDGNLWLICPSTFWKAEQYVANAFTIGP